MLMYYSIYMIFGVRMRRAASASSPSGNYIFVCDRNDLALMA